jgi:hypothetical protein
VVKKWRDKRDVSFISTLHDDANTVCVVTMFDVCMLCWITVSVITFNYIFRYVDSVIPIAMCYLLDNKNLIIFSKMGM